MAGWRKWFLATALVLTAAAIVLTIWWRRPPDPVAELQKRAMRSTALLREPVSSGVGALERWRIITTTADTIFALFRPAPTDVERPWTIVLMGGLGTGDRAATLMPPELPAQVLAIDWPWRGPRKLSTFEAVRQLPAIREAVLRSPAVFALGVDVAAAQPEVDRIAVVGASLGAPTVIAALRLTAAPSALVLVDGFADVRRVLEQALRRTLQRESFAPPLAAYAARLLDPLEPSHHAAAARSRPILLLNTRDDERIPIPAIEKLWEAFPHAEKRWRDGLHLRAHRTELIAALAEEVALWLDGVEGTPGVPRARSGETGRE